MIKINGVDIPAPSEYQIEIQDLTNTERNANGSILIERIATKRKIELSWRYLRKEQLSSILTLVNSVFLNVEYIDPQDGARKSGIFYCGDRSAGALSYANGEIKWKDIKFNLIER